MAALALPTLSNMSILDRARLLADTLDQAADKLVEIGHQEPQLPATRLRNEISRRRPTANPRRANGKVSIS